GEVVETDPALAEAVVVRRPRQRRAEHETRGRLADPVAQLAQVGEVLVEHELRQRRVERARPAEVADPERDVMEADEHGGTLAVRFSRDPGRYPTVPARPA